MSSFGIMVLLDMGITWISSTECLEGGVQVMRKDAGRIVFCWKPDH